MEVLKQTKAHKKHNPTGRVREISECVRGENWEISVSESRSGDGVHVETPRVGFRLRAFTERRFGVWEDGRVVRVNNKLQTVTIAFDIGRGRYKERRPFSYGAFFYPRGHPHASDFFTFA